LSWNETTKMPLLASLRQCQCIYTAPYNLERKGEQCVFLRSITDD
jgi:hypothetical protein